MPSAGAVGRSLYECTATSISPASSASRSAETNTPVPPIWASGALRPVALGADRDDLDRRGRARARRCSVWVRASALARVPTRRVRTAVTARPDRRPCGRRGDRLGGGRVEVEQLAQRGGVRVAAGRRGQFLHPDGRRVQHLLDRAAHRAGHLGRGRPRRGRAAGRRAGQLGVDHLVGPGPQRGDGRGDRELLLLGQVVAELVGHDRRRGLRPRRR